MAPVALPAGQSAFTELQIEPVLFGKQSAAADIAERQVDFLAGATADVIERGAERAGGGFLVHPERQRDGVRQRRGEGRRIGTADRRQLLRESGRAEA